MIKLYFFNYIRKPAVKVKIMLYSSELKRCTIFKINDPAAKIEGFATETSPTFIGRAVLQHEI